MTEPTWPPVSAPGRIPEQATPWDHPTQPESAMPPPPLAPTTPKPADVSYAHWGLRVAATLIDSSLQIPFLVVQIIGLIVAFDGGGLTWVHREGWWTWNDTVDVAAAQVTTSTWIGLAIANVASIAGGIFSFRNSILRQGRRGASLGKLCMNIVVVSETDGRPIGAPLTWVRNLAHLLDLVTLGFGFLWPLWDRKRQTFADMLMGTAVLHLPPAPKPVAQIPLQATAPYGS